MKKLIIWIGLEFLFNVVFSRYISTFKIPLARQIGSAINELVGRGTKIFEKRQRFSTLNQFLLTSVQLTLPPNFRLTANWFFVHT